MDSTLTVSPYFSPKSAMAPMALAVSMSVTRVSTGVLARTCSFTIRSMRSSSSAVTASKWEKSNRSRSALTREPFWATCSPSTVRSAACRRWVAEWLRAVFARRSPFTSACSVMPGSTVPATTRPMCR